MFRVATSLCRLLFEKAKVNDTLLLMTILSTDLKALKRRGYNGEYGTHLLPQIIRLSGNVPKVDKILKQQQQDRKTAEEARRSRYIGSEPSSVSMAPVPLPVAPQPQKASPMDAVARSKSPTRRPGVPGGWEPSPGSPPPTVAPPRAATPSIPEQPWSDSPATRTPSTPSTPEPSNNAYPVGNALQQLRRKLISHMPSSSELVRSSPSPQTHTRHVTPQSNIRK